MVEQSQPEAKDSLLDCLYWVAKHYERPVTKLALVDGLPLNNAQLTPNLLPRAAVLAALHCKIRRTSLTDIPHALMPAILLLKDQQACVLISAQNGMAQLMFPAMGNTPIDMPLAELEQHYIGRAALMKPAVKIESRNSVQEKEPPGHWFWQVIQKNKRLYGDVALAALLINLFALAMPLFVMNVYDRVVPNQVMETLWVLAVGVFIVLVGDFVLRSLRTWYVDQAAIRADTQLSARIMAHVLGTRLEAKPASAGSFASVLQAFEAVRGFIGSAIVVALVDLPFFLLFLLVIALIKLPLAIPVLVGAVAVLAFSALIQRQLHAVSLQSMQANAQRNATLVESLVALETVKSFQAEAKIQRTWEQTSQYLAQTNARSRQLSAQLGHFALWAQHTVAIAVIIVGVYLIADNALTQGALIASYLLSSRAMAPISQAAGLIAQYHQSATALQVLNGVMDNPLERTPHKQWVSRPQIKGNIEFRDVSFHYPNDERAAVRNISFSVKAGERVGILGRNGSGKSSLFKLMLGLYQPSSGAVLVDGVDVRQLDPAEWRGQVGYVPQDVTLFYGSIRENVTLSQPNASDEAILHASQLSGLYKIIDTHPLGFDLPVGERGELLSGGQRQSVGIARALIRQPNVLLLDEPTGAMDHSAEEEIKKNLLSYSRDKTLFVVTHRSSLLDLVDRIIVIDNGVIVADGPKAEVIEALRHGHIGRAT